MSTPMQSGSGKSGTKLPKGYKVGQIQQFTPEQMELLKQMMDNIGPESFISRLAAGDESLFTEMEAPAFKQFNEVQSQTASRFSGAGMGARGGSGFRNQMNQQTSDFAQGLQSKRMELRNQAIKDLQGMSHDLLNQRPYEQFAVKKQQKVPWWKQAYDLNQEMGDKVLSAYQGFSGGTPSQTQGAFQG